MLIFSKNYTNQRRFSKNHRAEIGAQEIDQNRSNFWFKVDKKIAWLTGPNLQRTSFLQTNDVIEACDHWKIASNPSEDQLIIHPYSTNFFYVYTSGVLKQKVTLEAGVCDGIFQMQIIGDKLLLGDKLHQTVSVYGFTVNPTQCSIDTNNSFLVMGKFVIYFLK